MTNLEKVIKIAKEKFDGHYSVFGFTTNVKGCYGTPNLDGDIQDQMEFYNSLKPYCNIEELLDEMANNPREFYQPHIDLPLKDLFKFIREDKDFPKDSSKREQVLYLREKSKYHLDMDYAVELFEELID